MFEKKTLQEAAGHNSGPPKQTYYCGSDCNLKWKKINWSSEKTKKVKKHFSKGKGKRKIWKNTPQTTAGQNSGPPRTTSTLFRVNIC